MKRIFVIALLCLCTVTCVIISCKGDADKGMTAQEETMTAGSVIIQVDNTVQPIVEDVLAVFGSVYTNAHITQVNRNENDIVNALLRDSARVAVLTRELTEGEEAHFQKKNIKPVITHFASDAVALIASKSASDTIVNLEDVYKVLQGKEAGAVKQLVFDNASSSTLRYLLEQAGVKQLPISGVYSLKSTEEVLKFVQDNTGSVGVIGVNWLVQPPQELSKFVENIRVLGVDNVKIDKKTKKYYKPSQSNIATGFYPLVRKLYLLNYQGKDGLGTGFANYLTAPEGQRIILKSGLMPVMIPPREIEVRNEL